MRTAVEQEEEIDSEITLNATTLLGIFFGLVLVCGVFFGFGYSIGRRGTDASSSHNPPASAEENTAPAAAAHTPKPSAMESLEPAETDAPSAGSDTVTQSVETNPSAASAPAAAPPARMKTQVAATKPTPTASKPAVPSAATAAPVTPAPGGSGIMVQIAAVTHQEDANVLVSALRQRGYSVSVHNEPQDKLLHVQVGPFATREAAKAMRAKLQADGYNAILKP